MAENRKRDTAIGVGGAGALAGTAALPRVEEKVKDVRQGRYDRKISRLQSQMPKKGTPVEDRKIVNGQYMRNSASSKQAKKLKTKKITGQINDLRAKKNQIKKPHLAGNAKATWAGIAVGAPALWHGTRSQFEKRDSKWRRRDADAAIVGAAAGAGGYQEASYALKPMDRRAERKIAQDPELNRRQKDYQSKMRPKHAKAGDRAWRPYFRNYPKDLPGGRMKRALAVSHTGKSGGALTVGAGLVGAGAAATASRKHRENKVKKSATTSAFGVDHG